MTIAATITSKQFNCNGLATQFAYPNKIFAASDLIVTLIDTLGLLYPFTNFANAQTGLSYSVQGVDVDTGCTVVMSGAPTNGWTLDVRSLIAELQTTSIKNQGSFLPELHEEAFDRLTRMTQDLLRLAYSYGIHGPDIETIPWPALPIASVRKGQALMFDAITGLPALGTPVTQVITTGVLAPFLHLQRSALEIAAGVIPTDLGYPDGNVLRYGADPTGATDSTYAFQQACLSTYAGWNPTAQQRRVYAPAGRYKFAGVNTPYGTPTVFVRVGMSLFGDGVSTFYDCSAWGAVVNNVFQLGWGFIGGVITQDGAGQPCEFAECFTLGGPSLGGAVVSAILPGWVVHNCFFSSPGLGVYMGGGKLFDCTFDIGLVHVTVGSGTQEIINCDFFNPTYAITFDTTPGDVSDVTITGCQFQYPRFGGIQAASGPSRVLGLKVAGCDFFANGQYSTFSAMILATNANMEMQVTDCAFHNWGSTAGASSYAVQAGAAGSNLDFIGCVFDGIKTFGGYVQSTTSAGFLFSAGTLRLVGCQFRNLPGTYGFGVNFLGGAACTLQISGGLYSNIGQPGYSISGITQAATAVVTSSFISTTNPFNAGNTLIFSAVVGMTQINGAQGIVLAIGGVSGAWTATVGINSTAFTAYASGGLATNSIPLVSVSNTNPASQIYIEGVKGDAITPLISAQGNVIAQIKNCTDWVGQIATLASSHYVLVPYQFSNVYKIVLKANINAGASTSYRKCTVTNVEKDNDFAAGPVLKSFLTTNVPIQGAANGNGLIATTVEFGTVGGGNNIASSNSGVLAVSWPNTYSLEYIDVEMT